MKDTGKHVIRETCCFQKDEQGLRNPGFGLAAGLPARWQRFVWGIPASFLAPCISVASLFSLFLLLCGCIFSLKSLWGNHLRVTLGSAQHLALLFSIQEWLAWGNDNDQKPLGALDIPIIAHLPSQLLSFLKKAATVFPQGNFAKAVTTLLSIANPRLSKMQLSL